MSSKQSLLFCVLLGVVLLTLAKDHSAGHASACKELNQINCYSGKNEGNFCSSKHQTGTESRWYYDKGVCRKFDYKGCNGNRNRFCTQESCVRRCRGE